MTALLNKAQQRIPARLGWDPQHFTTAIGHPHTTRFSEPHPVDIAQMMPGFM